MGDPVVLTGDGKANVQVAFEGMSLLHRGYFSTPEFVEELTEGLSACVDGDALVVVKYDSKRFQGSIVLRSQSSLKCRPKLNGSTLQVAPLVPVTKVLATYRERVAGKYDLRVSSFDVGVRFQRGKTHLCELWARGQFPPDGTTFSRCFSYLGNKKCTEGDPSVGTLMLKADAAQTKLLRGCFGR